MEDFIKNNDLKNILRGKCWWPDFRLESKMATTIHGLPKNINFSTKAQVMVIHGDSGMVFEPHDKNC